MKPDIYENLTVSQCLERIMVLADRQLRTETREINSAGGLVLAKNTEAARDVPNRDNSAMDGYLVRRDDLRNGLRKFTVTDVIRPEDDDPEVPGQGTCFQITTGGAVPSGELLVIPVENTTKEKSGLVVINEVPSGNAVRKKGEGYAKGRTVLKAGTLLRPYETALLKEAGLKTCAVYTPLKLALQVTGNEVNEETDLNGPMLSGLCGLWPGVESQRMPVLRDDPRQVSSRLRELAETSDIVLTTGGISAGAFDYIPRMMKELGAETLVRGVKQKPGKPFTVNILDGTVFFHLPGNPVSAVFCAEFYVSRFLRRLQGLPPCGFRAVSGKKISNPRPDKELFLTGKIVFRDNGHAVVIAEGRMRSHLMQLYTGCDIYVRIPAGQTIEEGAPIDVYPLTTGLMPSGADQ